MKVDKSSSLFSYRRRTTNEVLTGDIAIGGKKPVRIQSMCNTNTSDIESSVKQAKDLAEANCEITRYTVRGKSDIDALKAIWEGLRNIGCKIPIVADVHFMADAAIEAAKIVEKVRINPGNFIDSRAKFDQTTISEEEYKKELERLAAKLKELIDVCVQNNTALRIGTNHGSLSDRIMNKYGNTVEGMVESAMEFLRICKKHNFQNVVVSMKSSNVRIMVMAYRSLVKAMDDENMNFPLHLGVTEAGDGLSARIKSAAGIGTLLAEGLGDTIRVSLTETPVNEIPVAQTIVNHFKDRPSKEVSAPNNTEYNPLKFQQRKTTQNQINGGKKQAIVVSDLSHLHTIEKEHLEEIGYKFENDIWTKSNRAADAIFVKTHDIPVNLPGDLSIIFEAATTQKPDDESIPAFNRAEFLQMHKLISRKEKCIFLKNDDLDEELISILEKDQNSTIILETYHPNGVADQRAFILKLLENGLLNPVIIKRNYVEDEVETMAIKASADIAPLFIDGFGDGVWLTNPFVNEPDKIIEISFEILQASRTRNTATEYIACPSCGRTLFNIEKVLKEVKERTNHLHHLKIAVMGCIVNGPGEMADADYGYIGAGNDKVSLYKKQTPVRKNIPIASAVDELIDLIKENGDWIAPPL